MLSAISSARKYCATLLLTTTTVYPQTLGMIIPESLSFESLGIFVPEVFIQETRLPGPLAKPINDYASSRNLQQPYLNGRDNSGRQRIQHSLFNISHSVIEQTGEEVIRFLPEYAGCDTEPAKAGDITAFSQWKAIACNTDDPVVMLCKPGQRHHQCRMASESVIFSSTPDKHPAAPARITDADTASVESVKTLSDSLSSEGTSPLYQRSCLFMMFWQHQFIVNHSLLITDGKTVSHVQCQSAAHEYGQRQIIALDLSQSHALLPNAAGFDGKALGSVLMICPDGENCQLVDEGNGSGDEGGGGGNTGNNEGGNSSDSDNGAEGSDQEDGEQNAPGSGEAGDGNGRDGGDGKDDRNGRQEPAIYDDPADEEVAQPQASQLPWFLEFLQFLIEAGNSEQEEEKAAELLQALSNALEETGSYTDLVGDLDSIIQLHEFEGINWEDLIAAYSYLDQTAQTNLEEQARDIYSGLYSQQQQSGAAALTNADAEEEPDEDWDVHFGEDPRDWENQYSQDQPDTQSPYPSTRDDDTSNTASGSPYQGHSTLSLAAASDFFSGMLKKGKNKGTQLKKWAQRRSKGAIHKAAKTGRKALKKSPKSYAAAAQGSGHSSSESPQVNRRAASPPAQTLLRKTSELSLSSRLLKLLHISVGPNSGTQDNEFTQPEAVNTPPSGASAASQPDKNAGLMDLLNQRAANSADEAAEPGGDGWYDVVEYTPSSSLATTGSVAPVTTNGNHQDLPLSVEHANEVPMLITAEEQQPDGTTALQNQDHIHAVVDKSKKKPKSSGKRTRRPPPPLPLLHAWRKALLHRLT